MDVALLLEYSWVLLVLIALEGVLSADNALVLAIMVKHLPEEERKKALLYGLAGAFVFRFASLFLISFLVDVWQIQAIGALYLLFIALNHMFRKHVVNKYDTKDKAIKKPKKKSGFWPTVIKVELADIAFAVDSILAAVALAMALTPTGLGMVGSLDVGQFAVVFIGGLVGLLIMRFAATKFVVLLEKRPGLESAAFIIVGWVGVKLVVQVLAHPDLAIIDSHFPHSTGWKLFFYSVLVLIVLGGWFLSKNKDSDDQTAKRKELEENI
ncbi:TerC family protein [Alkalicoccobacillus porphyridii]|uniref:TerC family protein n=1 Tax=Alkalicoccobacillus porphyridii TaxID=2597270 RepID=A0A553ZVS1_9BACI|nr:TerC family protein [Alkalicoccobacillus porphyridii]TSB45435.1 TerC family protein [Alkalicoccobacillus porphyridii]